MSLWVDKYRPTHLLKLDFHKTQAEQLKNMVQQGDFPHLLVYGPPGAGKKTRVICLLRELYGAGAEKIRMENTTCTTPSHKKVEIMTISSNYHIEVNPSDVGIYDRVIIQELLKNVAQTHQFDPTGQREFKVVVVTQADRLTKDAQHALRRTMEKYMSTCRLILIANSPSRIIGPIRSRCLGIRVPAPSIDEIVSVITAVGKKEGLVIPSEFATRLATTSKRNLRLALLSLQAAKAQSWFPEICPLESDHKHDITSLPYPFTSDQTIPEVDWLTFLNETAKIIVKEQSPQAMLKVRERIFELLTRGVPPSHIFKHLTVELVRNCYDQKLKTEVVEWAAEYDHRLQHGSKAIFHLEAFIARFMCIYKKFMEENLGGFDAIEDTF